MDLKMNLHLFLSQKQVNTFVLLLSARLVLPQKPTRWRCASAEQQLELQIHDGQEWTSKTRGVMHWSRKLVREFAFVHWTQNMFTFCLVRCGLWRKTCWIQHIFYLSVVSSSWTLCLHSFRLFVVETSGKQKMGKAQGCTSGCTSGT